jgi:hypothetical protein
MSEYVSPSTLCKVHIDMDLTATAIEDVACEMGVQASELIVFCSRAHAPFMRKIIEDTGCTFVLVPNEIVKNSDCWAAHHKERHEFGMWSLGA